MTALMRGRLRRAGHSAAACDPGDCAARRDEARRPLTPLMERLLVIPAAGLRIPPWGAYSQSFWRWSTAGRCSTIYCRCTPLSSTRVALVVHPAARGAVMHVRHESRRTGIDVVVQEQPTGMLDAILLARRGGGDAAAAARVDHMVRPDRDSSAHRCPSRRADGRRPADWRFRRAPVRTRISTSHATRSGRIVRVLHRREGDVMPAVGESDAGPVLPFARARSLSCSRRLRRSRAPAPRPASETFCPSSRGPAHVETS